MSDQFTVAHLQRIAEMDPSPVARDLARYCLSLRQVEKDAARTILAREIARDVASADPLDNLDAG